MLPLVRCGSNACCRCIGVRWGRISAAAKWLTRPLSARVPRRADGLLVGFALVRVLLVSAKHLFLAAKRWQFVPALWRELGPRQRGKGLTRPRADFVQIKLNCCGSFGLLPRQATRRWRGFRPCDVERSWGGLTVALKARVSENGECKTQNTPAMVRPAPIETGQPFPICS